jgi:hypothetical protein
VKQSTLCFDLEARRAKELTTLFRGVTPVVAQSPVVTGEDAQVRRDAGQKVAVWNHMRFHNSFEEVQVVLDMFNHIKHQDGVEGFFGWFRGTLYGAGFGCWVAIPVVDVPAHNSRSGPDPFAEAPRKPPVARAHVQVGTRRAQNLVPFCDRQEELGPNDFPRMATF